MQRKFVNNLFYVLFLNLLVKPFWILGIDASVQNRVGAEEYGFYYPIFAFSILLNILLDFGITNYNNRNIAQHGHMLRRYFSGIFNVKLILGGLYLLVTLIGGWLIGFESKAIWLLFVLGINQTLSSMVLYLRSNLAGLHLFKTDGFLSVLDRLLMIAMCSVLLWGDWIQGEFKIEWFVYAQFWAYLLSGIVAFIIVFSKAKFYKLSLDIPLFRVILRDSLPFALLVLLMSFYYRLDSVMIGRLLPDGNEQAGIYAQAYRLLEGFNMFAYLFAGLLLPIFSRMLKNKESVAQLVRTAFNLIFIPATAVMTISLLYPAEIMDLIYVAHIEESAKIYGVLMISFIAIALSYIYGTLLTANGSLKQLNIISLIGLLLNLGLNFWLIPLQGAYGAAVATLVTHFFVILAQILVTKKVIGLQYSFPFILKQAVLFVGGIALGYYSKTYFASYIWHAVFIFSAFGGGALLLGLVSKVEILSVLRKRNS